MHQGRIWRFKAIARNTPTLMAIDAGVKSLRLPLLKTPVDRRLSRAGAQFGPQLLSPRLFPRRVTADNHLVVSMSVAIPPSSCALIHSRNEAGPLDALAAMRVNTGRLECRGVSKAAGRT